MSKLISPEEIIVLCCLVVAASCDCPGVPPCSCSGTTIYCTGLNLTSFPVFKPLNGTWELFIYNNSIRTIPSKALVNVSLGMLLMNDNQLQTIADDAFDGQENHLQVLHLYRNELKQIPNAIGKLQKLMALYIYDNPMQNPDTEMLSSIAESLTGLAIGSTSLKKIPSFRNLRLSSLDLYSLSVTNLPEDIFDGFEDELEFFSLQASSVMEIPSAMNRLKNLQDLSLVNDDMLRSLQSDTVNRLSKLQHLTITNCPIDTLPPVFGDLKSLYMVYVSSVPVSNLRPGTFSNASKNLWYVRFNDTQLSDIPTTISEITALKRLELTFSLLKSVRKEDLSGLPNLNTLYLSDNPISSIADEAFQGLESLGYLSLQNTSVDTIPPAIQNLPKLFFINLLDTCISCTCNNLGWIKHWKNKPGNLQILGDCSDKHMSLMAYIYQEVPRCP